MRPIEFRVWEREWKQMFWFDLRWGNRYNSGDGWLVALPIDVAERKYSMFMSPDNRVELDPDNCEIMQFTGLLDKNGKKIFEGDIVKWTSINSDCGKEHIDKIAWDDIGACFILLPWIHEPYAAEMDVIGNIYQNPELMEEVIG